MSEDRPARPLDRRDLFVGEIDTLPGTIRNGPNTVSESTVSNTELSELFGPHRVPGRTQRVPLRLTLSLLFVFGSELTEFFAELTEFAAELSEFTLLKQCSRNSILPVSQTIWPLSA